VQLDPTVVTANLPELLTGVRVTLTSFAIALALGLVIAVIVCAMRLRRQGALAWAARVYLTVFRAIPEIVLIFWMFYVLPVPLGFTVSGLASGSVALGLVAGAFLAEIFRAGVESVPPGQWEAARSLGLPRRAIWLRIVIPQAARLTIPPFINYMTELLKGTTLLATIGVADLALKAYVLGAQTFRYLEFLSAIAILYFIIIFPVARLAEAVERRLAVGRN
jgi:His/Glu/Gln/Arg/opine family amino acid ABC transporter permease subunit